MMHRVALRLNDFDWSKDADFAAALGRLAKTT